MTPSERHEYAAHGQELIEALDAMPEMDEFAYSGFKAPDTSPAVSHATIIEEADESAGEQDGMTPAHSGSVSPRARQLYVLEAMRKKDHRYAAALAFLFGGFGVHKFYLGCNRAAFVMLSMSIVGGLMTFGVATAVMWLIAIIEGFIYLTRSQSTFDFLYVVNQRDWF